MISMLRRMFGAKHVEWRPVSTSMANATVFMSLTQPGDILLSQPEAGGGNYSYNEKGPPRAARLDVRPLAMLADSFEIDTKRAVDQIAANRPKLVVVGGSNVLFPYPVEALSEAARQVGAKLLYDAAHVALFIGCGMFQDPFREGADLMTFSSHKIMSGPVGGVILMNDDEIASKVLPYSFPTLVQTRDQNKFASSAHALAEMAAFGADYASQMHHNAVALANSLQSEGLEVLCADRNFTQTHQIFVLIADEEALQVEQSCQQANLLVTRAQRMEAVGRAGLRLTTQEITRRGMSAHDMPVIARWLRRLITNREAPSTIAAEIQEFLKDFRTIKFSFDDFPQQSRGYS
jgi:glycine hydroxymethyltransferase